MQDDKQLFHEAVKQTCNKYLQVFPGESERLQALRGNLSNPNLDLRLRSSIPQGHMCASGMLLLPGNKLLMLEHKALGIWVVPGGHFDIEDGELANTAIRETVEETGLDIPIKLHPWHLENGIPLDIDTHPIPRSEKKDEDAHQHFDFRYILAVDDPTQVIHDLNLDTNEVTAFAEVALENIPEESSIYPAVQKLIKLGLIAH